MKKLIIIAWGILLFVTQGTTIGMEEEGMKEILADIDGVAVIVKQGHIADTKSVGAIVNETRFDLNYNVGHSIPLSLQYEEWAKRKRDFPDFHEGGGMRAIISKTDEEPESQKAQHIIDAVGPEETDEGWK